MDNFRIPPSPTWFTPAACTPDNGILYIAGNHTSIAYVPAFDSDAANDGDAPNIQIIQTHNQFVFAFHVFFSFFFGLVWFGFIFFH